MTQTDERERDTWSRRPPMTKHEKLEEIRRLRETLQGTKPKVEQ